MVSLERDDESFRSPPLRRCGTVFVTEQRRALAFASRIEVQRESTMLKLVRISSPRPSESKPGRYEALIVGSGEPPMRVIGPSSAAVKGSATAVVAHSDRHACDLRTALRAVGGQGRFGADRANLKTKGIALEHYD
jgi:hypothetical protein